MDGAKPAADAVRAGQAVYTPAVLWTYDWLVLGVSNRWIWRCPTAAMLRLYNAHVSANHLEVGVGTGYFLDRCLFPHPQPRLVLADLNENCLAATARRVARYGPQSLVADVFQPLPADLPKFDSIGLNYVLHCLPGDLRTKAVVFANLHAALNPGGVLFGATILARGVRPNWLARRLMRLYNRKRIFCNADDGLDDLQAALAARFSIQTLAVRGCVALFAAQRGGA